MTPCNVGSTGSALAPPAVIGVGVARHSRHLRPNIRNFGAPALNGRKLRLLISGRPALDIDYVVRSHCLNSYVIAEPQEIHSDLIHAVVGVE
jgi:hypothetical protein